MIHRKIEIVKILSKEWKNVTVYDKKFYYIYKNSNIKKELKKLGLFNFIDFLNQEFIIEDKDVSIAKEVLVGYNINPEMEDKKWSVKGEYISKVKSADRLLERILNKITAPNTIYEHELKQKLEEDKNRLDEVNNILLSDFTFSNRLELISERNNLRIRINNNEKRLYELTMPNVTTLDKLKINGYF